MSLPMMRLRVDERSPIPIRRQLTEQLKHAIEGGAVPRDQALPSIRELAGFLGINPNTVARVVDDLKRSGYVEARRGRGVFVAPAPPVGRSPSLRTRFLQSVLIRAAALGMTAEDVAVSIASLGGAQPPAVQEEVAVLLVECSQPELDFFAGELEGQLPVRVDGVLLEDLAAAVQRPRQASRWRAAVTSFCHLPEVERLLVDRGIPVIALLAEAHLETLHRLAQLPTGTRVGVAAAPVATAHSLEHSIANAHLPNIAVVGTCPAQGAALGRLVRRVDVVVCSTAAGARVRALAGPNVEVVVDDRALDPRGIEMLAAILVEPPGGPMPAAPPASRGRRGARPPRARGTPARRSRDTTAAGKRRRAPARGAGRRATAAS